MIHIGSFEVKTEIFVLIVSLILMSIQILLCFKVKKTALRLIPVYLTSGLVAVFGVWGIHIAGLDAILFFGLAICSAFALFMCGIGWAIWWLARRIKQRNKATKTEVK